METKGMERDIRKVNNFNPESFSNEEVDRLIEEIEERLKDVVYMGHKRMCSKVVYEFLKKGDCKTNDEITFTFRIYMCGGDILQIIGRMRREKKKRKRGKKKYDS